MKVLVVATGDDGQRARAATEAFGYRCRAAIGAEDGRRAAESERFDVAIVAPTLADGDGIELCRELRARESPTPTYLVLFGASNEALVGRALAAGIDDLLGVPLVEAELHLRLQVAERMLLNAGEIDGLRGSLERARASLLASTRTDSLTGLGNRLQLADDLDLFQGQLDRYGHRYAAALLDLDLFKPFSEVHGQLAGEEALRVVAQTVAQQLRTGDRAYRYGGDQFVILLPQQSLESARIAVERIRDALGRLAFSHGGNLPWAILTLSAGIATFADTRAGPSRHAEGDWEPMDECDGTADMDGEPRSYRTLLARAEAALRVAKAAGRNQVACAPNAS